MAESLSTLGTGSQNVVSVHQLAAEHASLDSQLQQLNQKRFLSSDEELEAVRIKKRKLHLKDAMRHLHA